MPASTLRQKATNLNGLDVLIALHTVEDPLPDEWDKYVEAVVALKKKNGGDMTKVRTFIVTDGGAPNVKQRGQLSTASAGSNKVVVVSNSLSNPLKRGIATAVAWANPLFKALTPDQWRDALRHVNLENQILPILIELDRLQKDLPKVSSLTQLSLHAKGNLG